MRRIATALHDERPATDDAPVAVARPDETTWGFQAIDGLPDLEAAPSYGRPREGFDGPPTPGPWAGAAGYDDDVKVRLTRIWRLAREVEADYQTSSGFGGGRELSVYEVEVTRAMTVRRVASSRLQRMLADDDCAYEGAMETVQAGLVMELMVPTVGGTVRRTLSDAMSDFESARHRVRVALVAVALDNGMTSAETGEAFCFSRQLASRYVKEARQKWPELDAPSTRSTRSARSAPRA